MLARLFKPAFLAATLLLAGGVVNTAHASVFGTNGLDPKFCDLPAVRQTVVYIDDTVMQNGNVAWAQNLQNKLEATLTPGERVTVVQLSPMTGTSDEIWSACWPDYSVADKQKLTAGNHFFSANPLKDLQNQQALFINQFLQSITKIYVSSKDRPGEGSVNPANPPKKEIIGALSSDSARFSQGDLTNRVIVYSDLAENSVLGNVFVPPPSPFPDLGQTLGLQFHDSVFYFFGVGSDVQGAPGFLEKATAYWRQVLQTTGGTVGGIGSTLNVPNSVPVSSLKEQVTITRDNQALSGTLSLMMDSEGNLIDSWLSVLRLTATSINGTFVCTGNDSGCALHAKTDTGVTILNVSESIDMTGSPSSSLSGTIGVPGNLTFPITASSSNN